MQVIFVRHGESESNVINRKDYQIFAGQTDVPLTALGHQQAEALRDSEVLRDADIFFVSDLLRTRETAAHFAPPTKIVYDSRLRERSLGNFQGKTMPEVQADPRYQKYFTDPEWMRFRHSFTAKAPGGENYADLCARVRPFLDELRQGGYGKAVIVAHFCVIRCLMKELQGLTEVETLRLMIPNCEPISIEI